MLYNSKNSLPKNFFGLWENKCMFTWILHVNVTWWPDYFYYDRYIGLRWTRHVEIIICTSDDVSLMPLSACALSKYVDIHYVVCFLKSNLKYVRINVPPYPYFEQCWWFFCKQKHWHIHWNNKNLPLGIFGCSWKTVCLSP